MKGSYGIAESGFGFLLVIALSTFCHFLLNLLAIGCSLGAVVRVARED